MCRLVAYAGAPTSVETMVFHGSHSLFRQSWAARELLTGSVNVDGYGVAWWPEEGSGPLRVARAEPIWYDAELRPLLASLRGGVIQATLRNATPGLPVDRSGLLPFVREGWSFSLNGWIPEFRKRHMRALRAPLSEARYGALTGVSDAETLFLRTLDAMDRGRRPLDALREVVDAVEARLDDGEVAPVTVVLSSAEGVHTLHRTVGGGPCNSLYLAVAPPWAPDGSVLASEPLDDVSDWRPVAPGSAVTQRADGTVERSEA